MTRVAQVIGLRPEAVDEYERIHVEVWPAVLDRLRQSGVRNYSIFRHGLVLFAYFEYIGDDFEADMAAISADETTQAWWAITAPMQVPVPEQTAVGGWHTIREVFHTD